MKELIGKAAVLIEALPYIQKFRNSIMVVKFGGSAMEDPELVRSTMRDVVLLEAIGIRPIVVHGGGKAISAELRRQDIPVRFVNGLRYTCEKTIKVVDDVLHNQVNAELVKLGRECGGRMIGLTGKGILHAVRTKSVDPVTGEQQDVGFVGEITAVNAAPIMEALEAGLTPIVTPLGTGIDGQTYNINADIAASSSCFSPTSPACSRIAMIRIRSSQPSGPTRSRGSCCAGFSPAACCRRSRAVSPR